MLFFELSIHQSIEKLYCISFQKILSSTAVFNIDNNVSWAANQHIRMISEGSCDTEEVRVMIAENSALHHRYKLHFKFYSNIYCIFDQIYAALASIYFFQKHYKKILLTPNFWTVVFGLFKAFWNVNFA